MNSPTTDQLPQLAPPGAGLPRPELFIAGLLFGWTRWRGSREKFTRTFEHERDRVLTLARNCDKETGSRRVLIKRIPGMEDSSRYWSVWMTLDHLRIIHEVMAGVILQLGKGVLPQGRASTAAVKPTVEVDGTTIDNFEKSCATLLKCAASIPNLRTPARYAHPWFGPLDAYGWYAMAGFHLNLHRRQIEQILLGAKPGNSGD